MVFRWDAVRRFVSGRTVTSLGDVVVAMRVPDVTLHLTHFVGAKKKATTTTVGVKMLRVYFNEDDTSTPVNFDFDPDFAEFATAASSSPTPAAAAPAPAPAPPTIPLFPICNVFNSEECIMQLRLAST